MQLSIQARRGLAGGLAISMILWSVSLFALPVAFAAPHGDNCLINESGTVYLVTGGQKRGYTSAEVFTSHGNNFGQVVAANSEDATLPVGPIQVYADGSLVKGPSDPLVYLVANGQKRGFVSGSVFTGLGFSFANIMSAAVNTFADLPTGANLESATERHSAGVLVNASGTIWQMTATGRKGIASMSVFNSHGFSLAKVVTANSADLAATDEGLVEARGTCASVSTPTGSLNVSLSGPAASTLINDESQAVLANFVFSGSGTVTAVTMQRTGISADTSLTNVYLFDGDVRVTDAASVTSGSVINFSNSGGLFSVSGTKTVSARADMAATAGETVGVKLTAVTLSSGSVGGLPVAGNNHSIATATLAGADLSTAPTGSGDTDPGTDINVWQGTVSVTTRDVTLNRLALRQIGSIQSVDIKNFRLFVDGVEIASQAALDGNGYVTFTLSKTLTTGSRVLKVIADVIGGSGRTVQMSLRGAYDIRVIDTQYNAAPIVTATGDAFPYDPAAFTVNAGTVTVVKASNSQSQNVTVGGSDVSLGTWTVTVYGEAVKLETLTVGIDVNGTDADNTFRNGRVMINGAQYGSTTHVAAADAAATGQSFTVNFLVNPGTPATVEFRADIFDNEGTDQIALLTTTTVQVALVGGATLNNAVPQVSLGTLDVPSANVNANSLTIASGSIALASTPSYPNQSTVAPQSSYKLASFDLTGNATEAVNLNTMAIGFVGNDTFDPSDDLTNVFLKYGGKTSSIKGTVADGSITSMANSWSVSETLPIDGSMTVEVWATIGSSITAAGSDDTMITYMRVTGITAQSGTTVYADTDSDAVATDNGATGQTITVEAGTLTVSKDASAPVSALVDDSGTVVSGAWKFESLYDGFTVTDITFTIANVSAVSTVTLKKADGTTVASKPAAATTTFNNVSVPVDANNNVVLKVELTMASVGVGAGTTGSSLLTTLTSATRRNSQGVSAAVTEASADPAGNVMYVYKAVPTVTYENLPSTALTAGTRTIAKFTVNTNGTGSVAWKDVLIYISKSLDPVLTVPSIWDVTSGGNTQVTAAEIFQNSDEGADADCDASDTTCELLITVGTKADLNVEETVSGAKTYEVRVTAGGAISTGEYVSTYIGSNLAHVDSAAYLTNDNDLTADDATFVWSDMSAANHDTGTLDWVNNHLLKFLPTTSNTMTN
ncbi:MAG: hypothetical protein HYW51_03800 [Candidatus Doudnabacteria bacterium]|nr:hypothetical protein [Candidatus Doudnabacteria bacterium]